MFKRNTVLVLGAGSSYELGFPTGQDLKSTISKLLEWPDAKLDSYGGSQEQPPNQPYFYQALYGEDYKRKIVQEQRASRDGRPGIFNFEVARHAPEDSQRRGLWSQISNGIHFSSSIDNYLHNRADNLELMKIGRAAIGFSIAQAERELLNRPVWDGNPFSNWLIRAADEKRSPAWTTFLSEICFSNCKAENIADALGRFKVVNFNYDRVVEQFIEIAARSVYALSRDEARSLGATLDVGHVYGSLGTLNETPFGQRPKDVNATAIKLFTETSRDDITFGTSTVTAPLSNADRIVFLGFGYHAMNMRLLRFDASYRQPSLTDRKTTVIGTSFGLSERSKAAVRATLSKNLRIREDDVSLRDRTCAELLADERFELEDSG
jgi:hypothetical protein